MTKIWWVIALTVGALITGCTTKVTRTNQLYPGMQPEQVKEVLGEPSQTQFISNKWIWKYSLHEPWKGFIPYYLAFSKENPTLEGWYANEQEYHRQQQLWMQAMPPTQHHKVDVRFR
jgi:outer membrane protein assembly factor BamE (lipoprotein component of BamABCDE complex)